MATIATAEVQVIADTRGFVTDLKRKLNAAFATLGNQLGDDIVDRIDKRVSKRLTTVMNQAARQAGTSFSQAFERSLSQAGLSDSLRQQLGGTAARRGAQRAGAVIADALGDGFRGSDKGVTEAMLDSIRAQTAIRAAGLAGRDTAEAFTENFRQGIRGDIQSAFDAVEQDFNTTVPSIFHRGGRVAGDAFGESVADSLEDSLTDSDVPSAFVTDFLNGITRRQTQVNQRMSRAGALAAGAFFTGIQNAQSPFGGAPLPVVDNFDDVFEELERTTRIRMRNVGAAIRDNVGGAADFASRAVQRLTGAITAIARGVTIVPLQNLSQLFSDFTTELASVAAMGLLVLGFLDQLLPLLFALPAALSLAGAGAATLVTAFSGMAGAFKQARGSAAGFEDAIKDLSPAAQNVAREFRALDDDLDRLRLDTQEALWSELEGSITRVADNIGGPLHEGMVEAGGALGELIDGFADFAAEEETAATIAATFDALTGIFEALADEIQPFLGGLRTLVDEFLPELESIEDVIDGIGTEFQAWVDAVTQNDMLTGLSPAQRAFQSALDVLQQLGRIAGNVAQALGSIFDAAETNSFTFLDLIERITDEVAEAFASPEGQETLADFLDDLTEISDVVLGLIGTIIEQFPKLSGPVSDLAKAIGPDLEQFVDNLGDGIAELIEQGGPFFEELAEALGDIDFKQLGSALGNILAFFAPLVGYLDEAVNFIIGIIDGIGILLNLLAAFVVIRATGLKEDLEELGNFLKDFFPRILDGAQDRWEDFKTFLDEFWPRVQDGAEDFWEGIVENWEGHWDDLTSVIDGEAIMETLGEIGDGIATFFTETIPNSIAEGTAVALDTVIGWGESLGQFFSDLWINLVSGVTGFFEDIAADFQSGFDGTTAIFTAWIDGRLGAWDEFWTSIKDAVRIALDNIGIEVSGSLDGVRSTFTGWQTGISEGWGRFWNNLKNTASNLLTAARDTISGILSSIRSTISGWIDGIRSRWNSFWNGLSGIVSSGLGAARSAVTTALNGIRDAFNTMSDRVRNILTGLRDFISGIFSRIQGIISNISSAISNAVSAAQNLGNIDLNPFANGGIVYGPTPALVGEAGREVIIPLTRPQRAVELVNQSGLMGLLAAQGAFGAAGGGTGSSPEIHVHSALADPEQIARRAVRILERQAARGLSRTGG